MEVLCKNKECELHWLARVIGEGLAHGLCYTCASQELDRLQELVRGLLKAKLDLQIVKMHQHGDLWLNERLELERAYAALGNAFASLSEAVK